MRSFEERRAEVFHRSENRIKERKNNRARILALCIPICLTLAVWSAEPLSSVLPAASQRSTQSVDGKKIFDELSGSVAARVFVSVEGEGNEYLADFVAEDTNPASRLREAIDAAFDCAAEWDAIYSGAPVNFDGDGIHKEELGTGSNSSSHASADEESGYTITFTAKDGVASVYTLRGILLMDHATKRSVILTDAQHASILDALARIMRGGNQ